MLFHSYVSSNSKISKRLEKNNEEFKTPKKFKGFSSNLSRIKSRTTMFQGQNSKQNLSIHQKTKSASLRKSKFEIPGKPTKNSQVCTPGTQDSDFCIEEDGIEVSFSSEESLTNLRLQVKSAMEFEKPENDSKSFLNFNTDLSIEEKRKKGRALRFLDFIFIHSITLLGFPNIK